MNLIEELTGHALIGAGRWLKENKNAWVAIARQIRTPAAPTAEKAHAAAQTLAPTMITDLAFELAPAIRSLVVKCSEEPTVNDNRIAEAEKLGAAAAQALFASDRS